MGNHLKSKLNTMNSIIIIINFNFYILNFDCIVGRYISIYILKLNVFIYCMQTLIVVIKCSRTVYNIKSKNKILLIKLLNLNSICTTREFPEVILLNWTIRVREGADDIFY